MNKDLGIEKRKKPFYKKWWLWLLLILLAGSGGVLNEYSNLSNSDLENSNSENTSVRDNKNAKLIVVEEGTYEVGTDMEPGRYSITSEGSGNLFINNGETINEVITDGKTDDELGVMSVTLDLTDGDNIIISKVNKATFTPVGTTISNTISAGYWIVGMDINEGEYTVQCADGEYGTISIFEGTKKISEETLDNAGVGVGPDSIDITLKQNQIILVQGMDEVVFN